MTVTTAHLILILPVLSIQRRFTIVLPPHATSTSTWHLTCARRASEVRQTQRGTIRAGRTLLAAARRILPLFIMCARRASEARQTRRGTIRTGRTLLAAARQTSTWHPTCARRASEVRRTRRGTTRTGRTLLAAARQIRPSFRTYARRAATGVPPMRAMRFQVWTPSVSILPVSKLSKYTSWWTTWRTTRTCRGTTQLKRYRSPRRAWKTAVFALATRLASRQPW